MLDAHPDLAVPPESWFVASLARQRHRFDKGTAFDVEAFVEALRNHDGFQRWALPEDALRQALHDVPPADLGDAVRTVFVTYALSRGKSRWGDKTPGYLLSMDLVGGLLPEARFVHLIRDGRNVAMSLVALDKAWAPNDLGRAALRWRRRVEKGRELGHALGPQRYREIRYEDLIENPEAILRDLCTYVEIPFDDAMVHAYQRPAPTAGASPGQRHSRLAPIKGLRDWSRDMPSKDLVLVEAVAGAALESLGLRTGRQRDPPEGAPPGPSDRARRRDGQDRQAPGDEGFRMRVHPAPGVLFVLPTYDGAAAVIDAASLTSADFAEALGGYLGGAEILTPGGVRSPSEVRRAAVRPAAGSPSAARDVFRRLPRSLRLAISDLRDWRRAASMRRTARTVAGRRYRLVVQLHGRHQRCGSTIARACGAPFVLRLEALEVREEAAWGVTRPGWGRFVERFGELNIVRNADLVASVSPRPRRSARDRAGRVEPQGRDPEWRRSLAVRTW